MPGAQDYNIPGTDITLKKEDMIGIPSAGLHHDEARGFLLNTFTEDTQ